MAMAVAFNKFNIFTSHLRSGVHDLTTAASGELKIALVTVQPVITNALLIDITANEIDYTNVTTFSGSGGAGRVVGNPTWDLDVTGLGDKMIIPDMTLEATTGDMPAWQWAVLYNNSPTSPADPLIGWMDYGSSLILELGEKLVLDFHDVDGLFTIV
jgi:hypothetical protein